MSDRTLERCICNGRAEFPETAPDAIRALPRHGSAANIDFDRDLVEEVGHALRATGYPALRDVQIEIEGGIVVLWGLVPNYHQKQLAQVITQQVTGVRGIANGIDVACCR